MCLYLNRDFISFWRCFYQHEYQAGHLKVVWFTGHFFCWQGFYNVLQNVNYLCPTDPSIHPLNASRPLKSLRESIPTLFLKQFLEVFLPSLRLIHQKEFWFSGIGYLGCYRDLLHNSSLNKNRKSHLSNQSENGRWIGKPVEQSIRSVRNIISVRVVFWLNC